MIEKIIYNLDIRKGNYVGGGCQKIWSSMEYYSQIKPHIYEKIAG
jgi:hypothetical protein